MAWVTRTNLKGESGTIDSATAFVRPAGSSPTVELSGTPSNRILSIGIPQGPQGPIGLPGVNAVDNDAAVAGYVSEGSSGTRAALNAAFERRVFIDANLNGVAADGATDDSAAWNAIVSAAPVGAVITWSGRSMLRSPIIWKSGVSLIGKGIGQSILATTDDGVTQNVQPAIRYMQGDGASTLNPLKDCTWADFEIDGSEVSGTDYVISAKGLFTLYHERCTWRNLYIHDTQATGLGCDFMRQCVAESVFADRCGRNNPGIVGGGAGIGIGTGAWENESMTISNCHTRDNGNWGIFVEYQPDEPFRGTGYAIIGCTSYGDRTGIGDRGTLGTAIIGCTVNLSKANGIDVSFGSSEGIVALNRVYDAGLRGIQIQENVSNYAVRDNHVTGSAAQGIRVSAAASNVKNVTVEGNHCWANGSVGILADSNTTGGRLDGLVIRGNRCWNNGTAGGSFTQGIRVDGTADGFAIVGNRCFDDQTVKTQSDGLRLGGSTSWTLSNGVIKDNNLIGNSANAFAPGNLVRTNVVIRENLGYVTESANTATIPDGATTVSVSHGLSALPTSVRVSPRLNQMVWVSARTSASFTIARAGTAGALAVDWSAELIP